MPTAPPPSNGGVLNSWKEIASYLRRGVRTVQRWEHDLGLPVRRPRRTPRSPVIALTADLDAWVRITPKGALAARSAKAALPAVVTALRESVHENTELRQALQKLRSAHAQSMHTLTGTIQHMQEIFQLTRQASEKLTFAGEPRGDVATVRPAPTRRTKPN